MVAAHLMRIYPHQRHFDIVEKEIVGLAQEELLID